MFSSWLAVEEQHVAFAPVGDVRGTLTPQLNREQATQLLLIDLGFGKNRLGGSCWAQVHGLRGQTSLAERVEWDNYYIAHWSLGLDLKILVLTFVALFRNAE